MSDFLSCRLSSLSLLIFRSKMNCHDSEVYTVAPEMPAMFDGMKLAAVATVLYVIVRCLNLKSPTAPPDLTFQDTALCHFILKSCPILTKEWVLHTWFIFNNKPVLIAFCYKPFSQGIYYCFKTANCHSLWKQCWFVFIVDCNSICLVCRLCLWPKQSVIFQQHQMRHLYTCDSIV